VHLWLLAGDCDLQLGLNFSAVIGSRHPVEWMPGALVAVSAVFIV